MEIGQTNAIFSIPLVLWKKIFYYCLHNKNNGKRYRINREDGVLVWFVALKTTSKQLNLKLDDQFFLEAVEWVGLHRLFVKKRIRYLIKRGSWDAFKTFVDRLRHGIDLSLLLPLVVQHTDIHFLTEFIKMKPDRQLVFGTNSILHALRRANDKESNDMMIMLWPFFVKINVLLPNKEVIDTLTEALKSGRKFNFNSIFIGFDEWILCGKNRSNNQILDLLLSTKKPAVIQIPEGSLLHLKYLNSTTHFSRGWSNMCIRDYNHSESCKIVYREKYSRDEHEILIKKETSANDIKYSYEGMTTSNLYELTIKTSVAEKLYGTYPHSYVALTKEALELPFDEQPWFVGLLSAYEAFFLASGAPSTTSFFTYFDQNGDAFIQWSNTEIKCGLNVQVYPENEKISKHLPANDFIFGISNYQHQESIKKYKAAKLITEGNLERLKQFVVENSMDMSKITDPNLIHYCVAQPKVHEEVLLWLLKNSPLETDVRGIYFKPTFTEMKICDNCTEDTIKKFLELKETIPQALVEYLILKKMPFDVLNLAVQKLKVDSKNEYTRLMAKICTAVHLGLKYAGDFTKRVLVMTAWKYGNEGNYFKLLPKELINQILSYEDIDEPLYFQLLYKLASEANENCYNFAYNVAVIENEMLEPFMGFWWKHWSILYTSTTARIMAKSIARAKNLSPSSASRLLNWFKRIVSTGKLPTSAYIDVGSSETLPLVLYCLESSEKDATEVLGLILQHKVIGRGNLLLRKPYYHNSFKLVIPTTWIAVLNKNLNTIKLLIEEDMLPDRAEGIPGHEPMSLTDLCEKFPGALDGIMEFINQCKRNKS